MPPEDSPPKSPQKFGEIVELPPFPGHLHALTPLQRVAFYLAIALFSLITIVSTAIVTEWWVHAPTPPAVSGLSAEAQKAAIDGYKALSDVVNDRTIRVFDAFVLKAFLPLFATIVGFLLGHRQSS
jgi:hypothetical protein